jgi:hypothetical protein
MSSERHNAFTRGNADMARFYAWLPIQLSQDSLLQVFVVLHALPSFVIQTVAVKKVASGAVAEVSGCWDEAETLMG